LFDQGNDGGFLSEPRYLSLLQSIYASYLMDTVGFSAGAQKAHHLKLTILFHQPPKIINLGAVSLLVGPGGRAV